MVGRRRALVIVIILLMIIALAPSSSTYVKFRQDQRTKFTSETINVDGEQVKIVRDTFGVPHILANSERGAYFGGGYAVAQDRLFQMERYRRDARGELAEMEGPLAFQRDVQARTLGYTEAEFQTTFNALSDEIKQNYQAYADGINSCMRNLELQKNLPEGFQEAGIREPAVWKVTDSIAIGILMAGRFGANGGLELMNTRILNKLREKFGGQSDEIFNDIFYLNDPKAPTTIANDGKLAVIKRGYIDKLSVAVALTDDEAIARASEVAQQSAIYQYARSNDLPTGWGSFCWAIAPARSASGSTVLVGSPEMGFSTPQIAHEIHYSAKDLNVIGIGFGGIPGVLIGHNNHLAWAMTSGTSDCRDIFAEKLNPQNRRQYFYKGAYRDMEKRVETIKIKGESPRQVEVYRTVHGPVVGWDKLAIEQASVAYSRATSYAGHESETFQAMYRFSHASNIREFSEDAELVTANYNFVAATADGDIGYWHCGWLPVRARGHDPRLPASGTGEFDWLGMIPLSKMPKIINPKQGYLINWNNKPVAEWNHGEAPLWGEANSLRPIEHLIKSKGRMTFDQIRGITEFIATDDIGAEVLKPYLLAAITNRASATRDDRIKEAERLLRAWDDHDVDDSVAKTIYDAWNQALRDMLFRDDFDDLRAIVPFHIFPILFGNNFLLHVLEGAESGVALSRDYLKCRSRDEVIVEALSKAIDELTRKDGPQMNLWRFKQGDINLKPLPSIPATTRGTYILAVELSKPYFLTTSILPPGQSENPRSPHYSDQREMAGYWRFKQMLYTPSQLEKALAADD